MGIPLAMRARYRPVTPAAGGAELASAPMDATRRVAGPRVRRGVLPTLLLAVLGLVAAACTGGGSAALEVEGTSTTAAPVTTTSEPTTTTEPPTTTDPPTTTTTEPPDPLVEAAAAMSAEQLVGQLLMVQLTGTSADQLSTRNRQRFGVATPAEVVAELELGGVVYLGENTPSSTATGELSAGLQTAAARAGLPPLLISVDQEGGRVNRLRDIPVFPSARVQQRDGRVGEYAATTGAALADVGINVVLGPVADVTGSDAGVIRDRAYSGDPAVAAAAVVTVVEELAEVGVGSVVKHWPGHGRTVVDSHFSLPTIDGDVETWRSTDQPPFAAAVDAGVDSVMLGHLAVPALDPTGTPATFSPVIIGVLRDELGFDGVVMTDSLQMGALASDDAGDVAVRALAAGVDVLLDPAEPLMIRDHLVDAVADGTLDRAVLEAAVVRVLRWKAELGLLPG